MASYQTGRHYKDTQQKDATVRQLADDVMKTFILLPYTTLTPTTFGHCEAKDKQTKERTDTHHTCIGAVARQ